MAARATSLTDLFIAIVLFNASVSVWAMAFYVRLGRIARAIERGNGK